MESSQAGAHTRQSCGDLVKGARVRRVGGIVKCGSSLPPFGAGSALPAAKSVHHLQESLRGEGGSELPLVRLPTRYPPRHRTPPLARRNVCACPTVQSGSCPHLNQISMRGGLGMSEIRENRLELRAFFLQLRGGSLCPL